MPKPMFTMTYELAMAMAADHANRQMRKACRTVWNVDDYNAMVEQFNKLWPLEDVPPSGTGN